MPGRTHPKWQRVYISGYDFSGYARTIGPLATEFGEVDLTTWADAIHGFLPNQAKLGVGTFNGVLDNTATTGLHVIESATNGTKQLVTVAIGDRAVPAQGDPCYSYQVYQDSYQATAASGAMTVNLRFGENAVDGATLLYPKAWGVLLNANTARVAANSSAGVDDYGAATALGGYFVYHVTTSSNPAHTATLSVDDSADNASFSALSGATTGSITVAAGVSGIVALGKTATVRRYLRYQIAFGTATSVTFVAAFVRGTF